MKITSYGERFFATGTLEQKANADFKVTTSAAFYGYLGISHF